ncbi:MAG: glycosyltransferase [Candidatus Kapabacteria bacterium]|nr:glycosyltransferase [Ignavibacteriota bacterium]MCW5883934.1 glycosyltransferase [Candidatus Kapabacteria bacterium]
MKLMYVSFCNSTHYQLLEKIDERIKSLKHIHKDIDTYVIGKSGNIEYPEFSFRYINLEKKYDIYNYESSRKYSFEELEDCILLGDYDVILLRYPLADKYLADFLAKHSNVVFEHHTKEELELLNINQSLYYDELRYSMVVLPKAMGITAVTEEILNYELKRANKKLSSIVIPNGINIKNINLVDKYEPMINGKYNFLCISKDYQPWQGLERLFRSISKSNFKDNIYCHIIGNIYNEQLNLIKELKLENNIKIYGQLSVKEIDKISQLCQMGVGVLSPYLKGLNEVSALKHRQFFAMGLPFFYGGIDLPFDKIPNYAISIPNNESLIRFEEIIALCDKYQEDSTIRNRIYQFAFDNLNLDNINKRLIEFLKGLEKIKTTQTKNNFQKNKKIVFFAGDNNNFHFVEDIIKYYDSIGLSTKKVFYNPSIPPELIFNELQNNDIAWFEWGNGPIELASNMPKTCKVILRIHRYEIYSNSVNLINFNNIDKVIFINDNVRDDFYKLHKHIDLDLSKTEVIYNAIDLKKYSLPEIKIKNFNIAFISRFHYVKNPALILQILSKLVKIDKRYKLFWIGSKQDKVIEQFIEYSVERLGLKDHLIYDGFVENVNDWLKDKSYILSTSFIEGLPLNILQAMAMGCKPIIHDYYKMPEKIFGSEYIFKTVDEAVELITIDIFEPHKYRELVQNKFNIELHYDIFHQFTNLNSNNKNYKSEFKFLIFIKINKNNYNKLNTTIQSIEKQKNNYFKIVIISEFQLEYFNDNMFIEVVFIDKNNSIEKILRDTILNSYYDYFMWINPGDIFINEAFDDICINTRLYQQFDLILLNFHLYTNDQKILSLNEINLLGNKTITNQYLLNNQIPNSGLLISKKIYTEYFKQKNQFFNFDIFIIQNIINSNYFIFSTKNIRLLKPQYDLSNAKPFKFIPNIDNFIENIKLERVFPYLDWYNNYDKSYSNALFNLSLICYNNGHLSKAHELLLISKIYDNSIELNNQIFSLITNHLSIFIVALMLLFNLKSFIHNIENTSKLFMECFNYFIMRKNIVVCKALTELTKNEASFIELSSIINSKFIELINQTNPNSTYNNKPFFSICIPTYNRGNYLKDAIKSALNQDYDNYEIVIVDDGSTDNTKQNVDSFNSDKIKYFYQNNSGRPKARNRLIKESKGEYILWLDSDDIIHEKIISEYITIIQKFSPDVIYCNIEITDKSLKKRIDIIEAPDYTIGTKYLLLRIINGVGITSGGALFKKNVLIEVGLINTEFLRAQDNELWTRLANKAKFHKVDKVLYYYRKHDDNISLNDVVDKSFESLVIRNIIKSNPLSVIFPDFDFNDEKSQDKALLEIASGLFRFEDYYNTINVLNYYNYYDDKLSIQIFIKSLIGLGDYKKAKEIINKYLRNNKQIFEDLDNTIDLLLSLNKIEIKASNAKTINDIVNRVTQSLQFIPSEIYLLNARVLSLKNELDTSFNYYKKAIGTSPENALILNEALEIGKKLNKENEILDLKNRILRQIEFYDENNSLNNPSPLVSVIIPTKDRPSQLRDAISSVLAQTYPNFELLVINDGGENVSGLIQSFYDNRVRYFENPVCKGAAGARNIGLKNAKGEYICYLDDDDIYYENHIDTLVKAANSHPEIKFFYTKAYEHIILKEYGFQKTITKKIVYQNDYSKRLLLLMNLFPTLCVMHHSSLIKLSGYFNENMKTHEDWEYWLRISNFTDFKFVDEITAEYRTIQGKQSLTNEKFSDFLTTMKYIYSNYGDDNDLTLRDLRNNQLRDLESRVIKYQNLQNNSITSNTKNTPVSIIIPVFNKSELTNNCLDSIYKNTDINSFELIIVDNGSTDNTEIIINSYKEKYNNLVYIRNSENLGYSKANNIGAKIAKYDYILLLNNDTIVTENWLEPLTNILNVDTNVAAVGSKLLFEDDTIQHAGVCIVNDKAFGDPLVARHIYYKMSKDAPEVNKVMKYQALTGACLMLNKSAYFEVNGLDEEYWNAYEDVDLCFKLREKGYILVYQPKSVVYHLESQSGPERIKGVQNSIKRLHEKWLGKVEVDFIVHEDRKISVVKPQKIKEYKILSNIKIAENANTSFPASIIILTYNSSATIEKCLGSVKEYLRHVDEVIVVDNNSKDNTIQLIKEIISCDSRFKIIQNNENIGFSAGNNVGIRLSKNPVIVLLNPDTIVTHGWLDNLTSHFSDENITAVGPLSNSVAGNQKLELYVKDEIEIKSLGDISNYLVRKYSGQNLDVKVLMGFCLAVRREFIEKHGGLDEDLFLGNDDLELSWRIRTNGGKLAVALDAFVYHVGQASFKTENKSHTDRLVQESTDCLYRKLENYYGAGNVPSPMEIWGINWFKPSKINSNNTHQSPSVAKTSKHKNLTSIIILARNQYEYTKECIDSIYKFTNSPFELVLVDNGSNDNIPHYFAELEHSQNNVKVISNPENVGFPKGVNQALRQCEGRYILIGNNDTVVTPNWLEDMIEAIEKSPENGLVGPISNNISGYQIDRNAKYQTMQEMLDYAVKVRRENAGQMMKFPRVAFFCTLIKREVIDKIGGLDEIFSPGNYEDDDFCMRAQIAGYKTFILKYVFIHHYRSRSFADEGNDAYQQRLMRNKQIFVDKWGGTPDEIWLDGKLVQRRDIYVNY